MKKKNLSFIQMVRLGQFYYFNSLEDFDKKIDWDGRDVSSIHFRRGVEKNKAEQVPPNKYFAYGTKY